MTVPDQTMSLKTMVQKYVRGLPIAAPDLHGEYTEDIIAQDFTKLDYATQQEILLERADELSDIKTRVNTERAEKAKQAQENQAKKDKEIEELKKQIEDFKPKS
ncbi:MAG: hypothetical protein [Arizlama microvirus]|nr:MAG: hypothetical protein [Arizlama microvirus]